MQVKNYILNFKLITCMVIIICIIRLKLNDWLSKIMFYKLLLKKKLLMDISLIKLTK